MHKSILMFIWLCVYEDLCEKSAYPEALLGVLLECLDYFFDVKSNLTR